MTAPLVSTDTGASFQWRDDEIILHPFAPPPQSGVSGVEFRAIALRAARRWNDATSDCNVPKLLVAPIESGQRSSVQDGANTIVMRAGHWCPSGARDRSECYSPHRKGITHLFTEDGALRRGSGKLVEADMELNAVHFEWAHQPEGLEALIAHEMGHVLGLDHSCGREPSCDTEEARASIMYPDPTEAHRSLVLIPDDASIHALCGQYGQSSLSRLDTAVVGVVLLIAAGGAFACARRRLLRHGDV